MDETMENIKVSEETESMVDSLIEKYIDLTQKDSA